MGPSLVCRSASAGDQRFYRTGHASWFVAMCERVLGPEYKIIEIGFDTPFQGAELQPWHRDFPSPPESYIEHRITSLAFNLTGVDVTEGMGLFEVAPGTQWDDGRSWNNEMFPSQQLWPRFEGRAVRKFPQMGDMSCRSAMTVHRGTANPSRTPCSSSASMHPEPVTTSCTTSW